MAQLTFTLAQLNPTVGDIRGNISKIHDVWKASKDDVVVFPECATSGYPPEDLVLRPDFLDVIEKYIAKLCADTKDFPNAAIIPTPWRNADSLYNAALLITDGKIQDVTFKHHLPDYGVFDDTRVFDQGIMPEPITYKDAKLGVLICEDMWFSDVAAHLKERGANILISVNASPFDMNKSNIRMNHAQARVKETGLPMICVNQIGGQDEIVFDGGSFILNPDGEVVQQMPYFDDDSITDQNGLTYAALKMGLKDYVTKNGFPGVVLGFSGGIDSALTAAIAVDALGADKVHCVMMPSKFTSKESLEDAKACAKALGVKYDTIKIKPMVKAFEKQVPNLIGVAHENIQSRIRGSTLMAISNSSGYMVVSTGNKSEMAVGYATLYGDMNGGFNPLKDLYKMEVYALAKWRNTQGKVIPENIITKAPSAELRDNQTDQDSLPPYDVLDNILKGLIERDMGVDDLTAQGFDRETVLKVWTLLDRAEYKRRQACPGVKVTARAFGRDRRYPITNKFLESF
ncbi:MAG: NAD+ synthase [Pseudomonadota bacterium]